MKRREGWTNSFLLSISYRTIVLHIVKYFKWKLRKTIDKSEIMVYNGNTINQTEEK